MFRTSLLNTVAFAAMFAAKGNLAVVEHEGDTLNAGGGEDTMSAGGGDAPIVEAAPAPVVTMETYDLDDIADLAPRTRSEAIDFGFKDWPVGGHGLVTADLADRARSAVQNAKQTSGKDNGKQFITRSAVGLKNKAGVVLYPNAKKGDIEVVRIRDAVAPAATVEAPKAETEIKVPEPA